MMRSETIAIDINFAKKHHQPLNASEKKDYLQPLHRSRTIDNQIDEKFEEFKEIQIS